MIILPAQEQSPACTRYDVPDPVKYSFVVNGISSRKHRAYPVTGKQMLQVLAQVFSRTNLVSSASNHGRAIKEWLKKTNR
ncbi:MAG: hypothetical protein JRI84_14165 [Deltaproteobacteria bacterium]|nr:hypothetical protein [Deltaproteobacteria bacterium]MBW1936665.1 hypothetical protein [Deltaproteobacteria bacterium]